MNIIKNNMSPDFSSGELVITRTFTAPRALVWKAWTDPGQLAQWWGPDGFTNPVCEIDLRPGGAILIHMRSPGGDVHPMTGEFREIAEPERLVFSSAVPGEGGKPIFEVINTVFFEEQGSGTKITIHARPFNVTPGAEQFLSGMQEGWSQSIDRLVAFVVKD